MPAPLVVSLAKKARTSVDTVEAYWQEAKEQAHQKFKVRDGKHYWAYVNAIVQRRLGLRESEQITFKDFIIAEGES